MSKGDEILHPDPSLLMVGLQSPRGIESIPAQLILGWGGGEIRQDMRDQNADSLVPILG